jgi:CRISPR/Cas system-associated endoribonuclease Cas2
MGTGRGTCVVVALVITLAVAGCGGSSDSSSSTGSISKEKFVAKADAICKKGTERLQKAIFAALKNPRNLSKVSKAEQIKIVTTAMVPNVSQEAKELRALGVPDGDEEKVDAMITALEEGVETAERDPQAVTQSSDAVFGISSRIAAEYGLKACSTR